MATFDYARLEASTVIPLIKRFGDNCSVVAYTDTPNPNPAMPPVRTRTEYPTVGVFLKYKSEDIDGTRVRSADEMVLLSADTESMPPEGQVDGDYEIVRDGIGWKMISVSILKPGPVTMLYKIQVRK